MSWNSNVIPEIINSIATEFDPAVAYSKDKIVWYDGDLYKAKEDVAAGDWDATKWDEVILAELGGASALNIGDKLVYNGTEEINIPEGGIGYQVEGDSETYPFSFIMPTPYAFMFVSNDVDLIDVLMNNPPDSLIVETDGITHTLNNTTSGGWVDPDTGIDAGVGHMMSPTDWSAIVSIPIGIGQPTNVSVSVTQFEKHKISNEYLPDYAAHKAVAPDYIAPTSAENAYSKGDLVMFDHLLYRSLQDNNHIPPLASYAWEQVDVSKLLKERAMLYLGDELEYNGNEEVSIPEGGVGYGIDGETIQIFGPYIGSEQDSVNKWWLKYKFTDPKVINIFDDNPLHPVTYRNLHAERATVVNMPWMEWDSSRNMFVDDEISVYGYPHYKIWIEADDSEKYVIFSVLWNSETPTSQDLEARIVFDPINVHKITTQYLPPYTHPESIAKQFDASIYKEGDYAIHDGLLYRAKHDFDPNRTNFSFDINDWDEVCVTDINGGASLHIGDGLTFNGTEDVTIPEGGIGYKIDVPGSSIPIPYVAGGGSAIWVYNSKNPEAVAIWDDPPATVDVIISFQTFTCNKVSNTQYKYGNMGSDVPALLIMKVSGSSGVETQVVYGNGDTVNHPSSVGIGKAGYTEVHKIDPEYLPEGIGYEEETFIEYPANFNGGATPAIYTSPSVEYVQAINRNDLQIIVNNGIEDVVLPKFNAGQWCNTPTPGPTTPGAMLVQKMSDASTSLNVYYTPAEGTPPSQLIFKLKSESLHKIDEKYLPEYVKSPVVSKTYDDDEAYGYRDLVMYKGLLYLCTPEDIHDTVTGVNPEDNPDRWMLFDIENLWLWQRTQLRATSLNFAPDWTTLSEIKEGDLVMSGDDAYYHDIAESEGIFEAKMDIDPSTLEDDPCSSDLFERVTVADLFTKNSIKTFIPEYKNVAYSANDIVTYKGKTYVKKHDGPPDSYPDDHPDDFGEIDINYIIQKIKEAVPGFSLV